MDFLADAMGNVVHADDADGAANKNDDDGHNAQLGRRRDGGCWGGLRRHLQYRLRRLWLDGRSHIAHVRAALYAKQTAEGCSTFPTKHSHDSASCSLPYKTVSPYPRSHGRTDIAVLKSHRAMVFARISPHVHVLFAAQGSSREL